jgi:hypothetical protein
MDFPRIGQLKRNEALEKVGEAEDWYQVRVKRDGTLGWVAARYLAGQPVSAPPETAAPSAPETTLPREAAPAEAQPPAKIDTVLPRASQPAEAAEPPPKPEEIEEPVPAEPEPEALPAKPEPEPQPQEPPVPPAPTTPEEKPERIRIM